MEKEFKSFKSVAFLIVILSVLCLPIKAEFAQHVASVKNFRILKYDVNEAFVGELKHVITIMNPTNSIATGVNLYVPIVRNETARHYVILCSITPTSGHQLLSDSSGNIYACWENLVIMPNQVFTVELVYRVLSFSITYTVNSSLIGSYNKNSELYLKYTQPEELIESDNHEIIEEAREITRGVSDPHAKARLIYNFVVGYLQYEMQEKEMGALWALEHRIGDCSEYSYLFVALCRAAGIPARIQAGFAFHYAGQSLEEGHMWAEYYLENYGWIPVDATWQLFDALDGKHFNSIGSTPEIIPYTNYYINGTRVKLMDKQTVQLMALQPNMFGDVSFAQSVVTTIQKVEQLETAISLGKLFGASMIFPAEMRENEQGLQEVKIFIQNAIDAWENSAQIANSRALVALEKAGNVLNSAWMLIFKTFAIYMGILIVLLLISLFFVGRSEKVCRKG